MQLPIKVLECNDRVAEAQLFCDYCGKLVRTSLIPKQEIETIKSELLAPSGASISN